MLKAKVLRSNRSLPIGFSEGSIYEVVGKGVGYILKSPTGRVESFSSKEVEVCQK